MVTMFEVSCQIWIELLALHNLFAYLTFFVMIDMPGLWHKPGCGLQRLANPSWTPIQVILQSIFSINKSKFDEECKAYIGSL